MSLYAYFSKEESPCLPKLPPRGLTLSQKEIERTNKVIQAAMDKKDKETTAESMPLILLLEEPKLESLAWRME